VLGEALVHSSRLRMELLKERPQLQRRAFATVRHDRHRDVVGAVEPPLLDDDRDDGNALPPSGPAGENEPQMSGPIKLSPEDLAAFRDGHR